MRIADDDDLVVGELCSGHGLELRRANDCYSKAIGLSFLLLETLAVVRSVSVLEDRLYSAGGIVSAGSTWPENEGLWNGSLGWRSQRCLETGRGCLCWPSRQSWCS
jgi:hypothetical protein